MLGTVLFGILLSLTAGVLAAASLIVSFKPNAKDIINKLTPFQGAIGLVLLGWGIWSTIQLIRLLTMGGFTLIGTATVALQLIVGFLLSFGLLSQFLFSKSEEAMQKGETIRLKLSPYQGFMGLALAGLSVWALIRVIL